MSTQPTINGSVADKLADLIKEGKPVFEMYAQRYDCDIIFYNGIMNLPPSSLMPLLDRRVKQKHALLLLVTTGGDPNSAYRLGRMLQHQYKSYTMYITGYCKSAGTLVALGANELVFSEFGELGPLDVQLIKPDDLFSHESGLTMISALDSIETQAINTFVSAARELLTRTNGVMSLKTAGDMAVQLTTGLYRPVYEHIDPLKIGETERAIRVAEQVGKRLAESAENLKPHTIKSLITNYPSHNFVIDMEEAKRLFKRIREPNTLEIIMMKCLHAHAVFPAESLLPGEIVYLNPDKDTPVTDETFAEQLFDAGRTENSSHQETMESIKGEEYANN